MNPEYPHFEAHDEAEHERLESEPRPAVPEPDRAAERRSRRESALTEELTPAEQEEKEKAWQQATAALQAMYEKLAQPKKPDHSQVRAAIDDTDLRELKPAYKRQLESVIVGEDLAGGDERGFVGRGLEVLSLWIHLQGLKRGTDRELAELRSQMATL